MSRTPAFHPQTTSRLVAIAFENGTDAFEMRSALKELEEARAIDTDDIVVATRDLQGKVKLHQEDSLPVIAGTLGSFLGLLVGMLLVNPPAGVAVGAGVGALAGSIGDVGISDGFMRELAATLKPGTSALFVLVHKSSPDQVLEGLRAFAGKGRLLQTSLTPENEDRLRKFMETQAQSGTAS
ncbi:hypothetical protein AYO49_02830 [Verrucomicrobiaceae bacterium SCGC AG-212-N21]|nr:hypothetical protein AYO49_02830 [Verrucomicrobiaceae bacterium SCGC AG-212-N21]